MQIDAGARAWMISQARKNYWRVPSWYELDDLIQEGYECWYYVVNRYPHVVDRPHMMRLFQLTFRSRITDLSNKSTRQVDAPQSVNIADDNATTLDLLAARAGMVALPSQAGPMPEPIRKLLSVITTPEGAARLRAPYRKRHFGIRETLNERLTRIIGCASDVDLVGALRMYLSDL